MPDLNELIHDSVINICIHESHIAAERSHEVLNLLIFIELSFHSVKEGFYSFTEIVVGILLVQDDRGIDHVVCVGPKA